MQEDKTPSEEVAASEEHREPATGHDETYEPRHVKGDEGDGAHPVEDHEKKSHNPLVAILSFILIALLALVSFLGVKHFLDWHNAQPDQKMSKVKDGETVVIGFKSYDGIPLSNCQSKAKWNALVDAGKVKLEGPVTVKNGVAESNEKTACLRTLRVTRDNSSNEFTGLKDDGSNLVTKAGVKYPKSGLFHGKYADADNYYSK